MMTVQYETQKKFKLEEMNALIEGLSPSDSAFDVNEGGEEIYFSSRLVERMQVMWGTRLLLIVFQTIPIRSILSLGVVSKYLSNLVV